MNARRVKEAKEFCFKKLVQQEKTTVLQLEQAYQALLGICFTMDTETIYRPLWDFEDMGGLLD